jgi:hypothetical protein
MLHGKKIPEGPSGKLGGRYTRKEGETQRIG